jgi:hypothetical protein
LQCPPQSHDAKTLGLTMPPTLLARADFCTATLAPIVIV